MQITTNSKRKPNDAKTWVLKKFPGYNSHVICKKKKTSGDTRKCQQREQTVMLKIHGNMSMVLQKEMHSIVQDGLLPELETSAHYARDKLW